MASSKKMPSLYAKTENFSTASQKSHKTSCRKPSRQLFCRLPGSGIPGKFPVDFFPEMTEILQICGFILYKSWLLQNKTVPEATHLEKVQKFRENICIFLTHML